MTHLLDTNWLMQLLAGHKETATFHRHLHPDKIAVNYITVGEIYDVAFAYVNPQAHLLSFRQFLAPFTLLTLNDPIMETFAEVRSYLRRRGELISDFDILIGTTALHHDLTVLTYNTHHFKRILDLKLYPPAA